MSEFSGSMWNIYYKDIYNGDPFWHLYNDFADAPVFKTKRDAKEYVDSHKDEFDGCEAPRVFFFWTLTIVSIIHH